MRAKTHPVYWSVRSDFVFKNDVRDLRIFVHLHEKHPTAVARVVSVIKHAIQINEHTGPVLLLPQVFCIIWAGGQRLSFVR